MRRQDAIHHPFGAEIPALVEQGRVDLGRGEIHESRLVEQSEDGCAFGIAERARGNPPPRQGTLGPPPPVVGRSRQSERRACRRDAEPRPNFGHSGYEKCPVFAGVPSTAAMFFWTSIRDSARSARFRQNVVARSNSAIRLSRGSGTRGTGPRLFSVVGPASSPRSRAARQVVRCDEYSASRRRRAPTAPCVLQPRPPGRSSACTLL